jgi:hypothetical protein
MAYLVKDDYTLHISLEHLDDILNQAALNSSKTADQIRDEAEETAKAEINAYLSKYYDTATEFAIDGATNPGDRNRMIKKCMLDITLYHLFFTVNPRDIPESRERLYTDCIDSVKAYRDGHLDFGLSEVDTDADGTPDYERTVLKSHRKFITKAFTDRQLLE